MRVPAGDRSSYANRHGKCGSGHLEIDAAEAVTGCMVDQPSGNADLDALARQLARQRAKFAAAHVSLGTAARKLTISMESTAIYTNPWP